MMKRAEVMRPKWRLKLIGGGEVSLSRPPFLAVSA
jgi:hypothetical protein